MFVRVFCSCFYIIKPIKDVFRGSCLTCKLDMSIDRNFARDLRLVLNSIYSKKCARLTRPESACEKGHSDARYTSRKHPYQFGRFS